MDAQFFVVRVNSIYCEVANGEFKTPSALTNAPAGGQWRRVETRSFVFNEDTNDYEVSGEQDLLYEHELRECPSILWASDREATIGCGMAIDLDGNAIKLQRPYYHLGAKLTEPAFKLQLHEMLRAIANPEHRPELATHYLLMDDLRWPTERHLVLERAERMANKHKVPTSSASSPLFKKFENEPEGWRCKSWEEVRQRCGSLDFRQPAQQPAASSSAGGTEPGTRPRTLGLRLPLELTTRLFAAAPTSAIALRRAVLWSSAAVLALQKERMRGVLSRLGPRLCLALVRADARVPHGGRR